jgi:hypothetical protein
MGWKGRHQRNWIRLGTWGDEYEIHHEEQSNTYGIFGVVGYDDEWRIIWRPNRNYTTDWKIDVMSKKIEVSYSNYPREEEVIYPTEEDAIAAIAHWQENFDHPKKPKRYHPRDSQKRKVYRWEHKMAFDIGDQELLDGAHRNTTVLERKHDHAHLQTFLSEICSELGEKTPELKFRTGGRSSKGGYRIRLLPCHCNHLVLIHELAHVLHRRWGTKTNDVRHQSHGKEFVGIYAYLLIRFGGIDKDAIIGHARFSTVNLLLPERYWEWKAVKEKAA